MKKIEKLTKEQEAKLSVYRDKWLRIGLATHEIDREKCKLAIDEVYKCAGLKPPAIKIFLRSPYEGVIGAWYLKHALNKSGDQVGYQVWDQVRAQVGAQVRAQVGDQVWDQVGAQVGDQVWDQVRAQVGDQVWDQVGAQVRDQVGDQVWDQVGDLINWRSVCYGLQDANWLGFLNYFSEVLNLKCVDKASGLIMFAEQAGWYWPFENAVVITERPTLVKMDDQKRLHCETGAAISYSDGYSVYAWHGTRIPEEWIKDKSSITPEIALKWENTEQRRCAMEIVGWTNILKTINAKTVDKDEDPQIGELLEVSHSAIGDKEKFLKVVCGTGRVFALPVPPDMKTALQANAWTFGLDGNSLKKLKMRT